MDVLVPFAASRPKTRLAGVLGPDERAEFAEEMLYDVCCAVESTGASPMVLSTDPIESAWPVVVDDRPLTDAVNDRIEPPVAVVMADLALVTPAALSRLLDADGDVVLAPGLGGGTNALLVRTPEFYVDYHGASIADHRRIATEVGTTTTVDSFRLAVDIDEADDLAEVLLHGDGRAARWLREAGIELETAGGRATVRRSTPR